jgi:hypothetical protein
MWNVQQIQDAFSVRGVPRNSYGFVSVCVVCVSSSVSKKPLSDKMY